MDESTKQLLDELANIAISDWETHGILPVAGSEEIPSILARFTFSITALRGNVGSGARVDFAIDDASRQSKNFGPLLEACVPSWLRQEADGSFKAIAWRETWQKLSMEDLGKHLSTLGFSGEVEEAGEGPPALANADPLAIRNDIRYRFEKGAQGSYALELSDVAKGHSEWLDAFFVSIVDANGDVSPSPKGLPSLLSPAGPGRFQIGKYGDKDSIFHDGTRLDEIREGLAECVELSSFVSLMRMHGIERDVANCALRKLRVDQGAAPWIAKKTPAPPLAFKHYKR